MEDEESSHQKQQTELLQFLLSRSKLSIEDVHCEMENMKNQKYLENHMYEIWQGNEGRWRTYLPDSTTQKERRLIAKSTREKIEKEVIRYYKSIDEQEQAKLVTLETWYLTWLDYKKLQTRSDMYIRRIASDWDNYYKDTPIITIPIIKLEYDTLQEWALRIVKEKKLTKKQYYNMAIIIRQALDYAVQKKLLPDNPFSKVTIDKKLFQAKKKPQDNTQVFLTDEQPLIEAESRKDFAETGATACLAVPLAFQTGLRLGEIVAIKESDVVGNYLHVQRMEVRKVEQLVDGTWSKQTFAVVDYTKSEAGDREVYLSKTARKIIADVIASNREHSYSDNGYLFLNERGRIRSKNVDYRIRKYCRHIGISEKALHKIRKTYISTLIDSGLNINEIRKLAGHEDERTTYNNYCFNRMTDTQTENLLEMALA